MSAMATGIGTEEVTTFAEIASFTDSVTSLIP